MTIEKLYHLAREQWWYVWRPWWKRRRIDRQDAIQAAVMACWKYLDGYDPSKGATPETYFRMIARHAIKNYANTRKNGCVAQAYIGYEKDPLVPSTAESDAILGEDIAALRAAMSTLRPETREAMLRLAGGDTMQAVADTLGCTRQAVMIRRDRALAILARKMRA